MHDEHGNPIEPSLVPIVEKLRRDDEVIWQCASERDGTVTILLLPKRELEEVKQAESMGLRFGSGRSIEVRRNGPDWEIVNEGTWIS